jgi:hypothetical protein
MGGKVVGKVHGYDLKYRIFIISLILAQAQGVTVPSQVVLVEGGKIDSAVRHLAAKGLPYKLGQPPIYGFEQSLLLGASDASRRAAIKAAASIAHFDENKDLTFFDHQIEFAERAAELISQQGAACLL